MSSPMGIPPDYKGLVRVTRVMDDMAKNYWGVGYEFYVDSQRGETDLLTPGGAEASLPQVSNWFHLTPVYGPSSPHMGGGGAMPTPGMGGGMGKAPSSLNFGGDMDDDDGSVR